MARFVTSAAAERDVENIAQFIARGNPPRAVSFAKELRARFSTLAENPQSFRLRDEFRPGVRAVRHGRYLILFRFHDGLVRILRVLHTARDIAGLL